jgi:hypothetical protein
LETCEATRNDSDGDCVADQVDLCPNNPEDRDSFEDEDGCPDHDNDRDRIADVDDFCPNEPEQWNAIDDCDGCPDRSDRSVALWDGFDPVTISFAANSSAIGPKQAEALELATFDYQCRSQAPRLRMVGYVADPSEAARRLAQARGTAVRDYFMAHGLGPSNLSSVVIERAPARKDVIDVAVPVDKSVIARLLRGSARESITAAWYIEMARLPRRERSEDYVQSLVANLKHPEERVRRATVEALGALDARVIPILKRARRREASKSVRRAMDTALLDALTRELEPGNAGSGSDANRREMARLQKNKARHEEVARREVARLKKNHAQEMARLQKNKARHEESIRREREKALQVRKAQLAKNKIRTRERRHSCDLPELKELKTWMVFDIGIGGCHAIRRDSDSKGFWKRKTIKELADSTFIVKDGQFCHRARFKDIKQTGPCRKKCLPPSTKIATPAGQVALDQLRVGMPIWTQDEQQRKVLATVLEISSVEVEADHELVKLVLEDGRSVTVSAGHPDAAGRGVEELRLGQSYDGSRVKSLSSLPYRQPRTSDVLPSGSTGVYWADGVPLGSTLSTK